MFELFDGDGVTSSSTPFWRRCDESARLLLPLAVGAFLACLPLLGAVLLLVLVLRCGVR